MIALRINLMNISAVTIFLARVVGFLKHTMATLFYTCSNIFQVFFRVNGPARIWRWVDNDSDSVFIDKTLHLGQVSLPCFLWLKKRREKTKILILKTIGNRKGDCAWSCSRWQTQPEKICKSQRTNQCHSLRTLYWFVLCNLQIFSGCVCHLEQLHAQSPFLFPIVFSINLIPFFDICSVLVDLLAVFQPGCSGMTVLLYLGRCAVATVAVCGFGSWSLVFDCGMPRSPLPQPPLKQKCAPRSRWEKAYMRKQTYK